MLAGQDYFLRLRDMHTICIHTRLTWNVSAFPFGIWFGLNARYLIYEIPVVVAVVAIHEVNVWIWMLVIIFLSSCTRSFVCWSRQFFLHWLAKISSGIFKFRKIYWSIHIFFWERSELNLIIGMLGFYWIGLGSTDDVKSWAFVPLAFSLDSFDAISTIPVHRMKMRFNRHCNDNHVNNSPSIHCDVALDLLCTMRYDSCSPGKSSPTVSMPRYFLFIG